MAKMKFGILGEKLGHSYSKEIHEYFGLYDYDIVDVSREKLEKKLKDPNYKGFNVTMPYKKTVYDLCDVLSDKAKKLENVNTVLKKEGQLYGYNTDYDGLKYLIDNNNIDLKDKDVVILGNGSAAHTSYELAKDKGVRNIVFISRRGDVKFYQIDDYKDYHIIINATPVGMYPNNGQSLIDIKKFKNLEAIIDLIYNPFYTKILLDAREKNIKAVNGLEMLVYQAKRAGEIFTGQHIGHGKYLETYEKIRDKNLNIALIGMPGVGKTTYAKKLSKDTNKKVLSVDKLIEEKDGRSSSQILIEEGENYFRELESEILESISKESGSIIDCGGGIVESEKNFLYLRQNSKIIWLRRDINSLSIEDRPISQANKIEDIYKKRAPLYERWADEVIDLD